MPAGLSKHARKRWAKVHWVVQRGKVRSVEPNCVVVQLLDERGNDLWMTHMEAQARLLPM